MYRVGPSLGDMKARTYARPKLIDRNSSSQRLLQADGWCWLRVSHIDMTIQWTTQTQPIHAGNIAANKLRANTRDTEKEKLELWFENFQVIKARFLWTLFPLSGITRFSAELNRGNWNNLINPLVSDNWIFVILWWQNKNRISAGK